MLVWAVASYDGGRDKLRRDIRHNAELDLLHGRLNQIATKLGLPTLDLDWQVEQTTRYRMTRIAHFSGLDELKLGIEGRPADQTFWDESAMCWDQ